MLKMEILKAAKETIENVKKEYLATIEAVFWETVRNSLQEVGFDFETMSYYMEIVPDDEIDSVSDSAFNHSETQSKELDRILNEMQDIVYSIFENTSNDLYIHAALCTDTDISLTLECDGFSIEKYITNRYNQK